MADITAQTSGDSTFLTRGGDYLKKFPGFELSGRTKELQEMYGILMRERANSLIVTGPGGVGCSALWMGMLANKDKPDTPFDIGGKRCYVLDTDALFSCGNAADIQENFKKIIDRLSRSWSDTPGHAPDSVLIIDSMRDFIDAARNNGCTNLINTLMSEIKKGKFQAIMEVRDDSLDTVIKAHSDMTEFFTLMHVEEPTGDELQEVIAQGAKRLTNHHGVNISEEAIQAALFLTTRGYAMADASLSRAQPERTITLLDRAMTSYLQKAHTRAPELDKLEPQLAAVTRNLAKDPTVMRNEGFHKDELEASKTALETDIAEASREWAKKQKAFGALQEDRRAGETQLAEYEDTLNKEIALHKPADPAKADMGAEPETVRNIRQKILRLNEAIKTHTLKFEALQKEINTHLQLGEASVFTEFSELSNIPVTKLTENDTEKLLRLEDTLNKRVYDQQHATTKIARAIRLARANVVPKTEPEGIFLLMGPTGVGKTETALGVTGALFDDERALLRFDMSEYQEKHAVAKLVGSPPGYEGFDQGGLLVQAVRKHPRSVILLDEMEKAHDDIFLLLLQVFSAARLTDNHGRIADFKNTIIIMTSNTGARHFLNPELTEAQAEAAAREELAKRYPPEFLKRINGGRNIYCYHILKPSTMQKIARREIDMVNNNIRDRGLKLDLDSENLQALCETYYKPEDGARGIKGYLSDEVFPAIGDTLLRTPGAKGVMKATFDRGSKLISVASPVLIAPDVKIVSPAVDFRHS